jgi:hypothetical protein
MGEVLPFGRRGASREVIDKLVKLGYLEQTMRRKTGAVEDALARLQNDLCRSQVISRSEQWLLSNSDDGENPSIKNTSR